jgi:hypothetical protein
VAQAVRVPPSPEFKIQCQQKIIIIISLRIEVVFHTWKCHNKTPYLAILNKNVFFFLHKWRTGRQNRSCPGVGTNGREEDIRKGYRRVNMMEISCIHVYK